MLTSEVWHCKRDGPRDTERVKTNPQIILLQEMPLPTSANGQADIPTTSEGEHGIVLKLKNSNTENPAQTLTEQTFFEQTAGLVLSSEGLQTSKNLTSTDTAEVTQL